MHAHDVALADSVRAALGLAPAGSAIVSLEVGSDVPARLTAAGLRASSRAGRLRVGFHHYNDENDVDVLLDCLGAAGQQAA